MGVSCSFTDTTTERLPFGLAAMNWVYPGVLPVWLHTVPHLVS